MISSMAEASVTAIRVVVDETTLAVELADGRSISIPLGWYPRLAAATAAERTDLRLIGNGHGIHWPALDEDISVENLLMGRRSSESPRSLQKWLHARQES